RRGGARGSGRGQSPAAADPARRSGAGGGLALRARQREHQRPEHRDRGRRGDVMAREQSAMRADVETRARPDDHQSLRLWLRLLACTNLIESQVRQRLKAGYATTPPRFDLMAQLARAEDGLKMGELSQRMNVPGG